MLVGSWCEVEMGRLVEYLTTRLTFVLLGARK
jgi:hypothetical protein